MLTQKYAIEGKVKKLCFECAENFYIEPKPNTIAQTSCDNCNQSADA